MPRFLHSSILGMKADCNEACIVIHFKLFLQLIQVVLDLAGEYFQFGKGAESEDSASTPVHTSADCQGRAAALPGR